jgi:hypothetical protein
MAQNPVLAPVDALDTPDAVTPSEVDAAPSPGAVLAEPCLEFAAQFEEPGVCAGCGWLEDDHQAAIETTTSIAA